MTSRARRAADHPVSAHVRGLLSVHLFPQMRNAVNIKTIISPTIDAVKSQLHTTEVFRFITQPEYADQRRIGTLGTASSGALSWRAEQRRSRTSSTVQAMRLSCIDQIVGIVAAYDGYSRRSLTWHT